MVALMMVALVYQLYPEIVYHRNYSHRHISRQFLNAQHLLHLLLTSTLPQMFKYVYVLFIVIIYLFFVGTPIPANFARLRTR